MIWPLGCDKNFSFYHFMVLLKMHLEDSEIQDEEENIQLLIGRSVVFEGKKTQVISYVRSSGKLLLAGIGSPVAIDRVELLKALKEELKTKDDGKDDRI